MRVQILLGRLEFKGARVDAPGEILEVTPGSARALGDLAVGVVGRVVDDGTAVLGDVDVGRLVCAHAVEKHPRVDPAPVALHPGDDGGDVGSWEPLLLPPRVQAPDGDDDGEARRPEEQQEQQQPAGDGTDPSLTAEGDEGEEKKQAQASTPAGEKENPSGGALPAGPAGHVAEALDELAASNPDLFTAATTEKEATKEKKEEAAPASAAPAEGAAKEEEHEEKHGSKKKKKEQK